MKTRILIVNIDLWNGYARDKYFPLYNKPFAIHGKNGIELVEYIGAWHRKLP